MKKQKNMIRILTERSFRKNRGRNLAAVLAIILTTMMFTALFTLAQSLNRNMTEMLLRQSGTTAHASTKQITDAQIQKLSAHPDVATYGSSIVVGLAENQSLAGRQVEIRYGSDQYAKDGFAYPTSGRMPQNENEIALDTLTLERLGILPELGQAVTLEWRADLSSSDITSSSFTLCGWWEANLSSYASMAWVSKEFALDACGGIDTPKEGQICGLRMMNLSFADSKNIEEKTAEILSDCGLEELEFNTNLAYTPEVRQSVLTESLPMYGGMLLVFLAGYMVIFNVFQISVAADIQFYGRLKTLGATTKQIKKLIYGQGNRLSGLGILLGLVSGYFVGSVLVPVFIATEGMGTKVSAHPVIFLGAAAFSYVTVIFSCLLPARMAGRVSPMEALRYTDADSGIRKKNKKSKNGASLPAMAFANTGRNKKRTLMVVCSITLGLVLMSFFYAQNASFDVEKYLTDLTVADYQLDDATNAVTDGYDPQSRTIGADLLEKIEGTGMAEETGRLYSREIDVKLSARTCSNLERFYTPEILEDYASFDPNFPEWKAEYDAAIQDKNASVTLYGADGLILEAATGENYILAGSFDAEAFATGQYVLAIGPAVSAQSDPPTWPVGETVEIANRTFTVMAVLYPLQPMVSGAAPVFDLPLVMPADTFIEIWPESNLRKYYFNVADDALESAAEMLTEYQQTLALGMNIVSRQTMVEQYSAQTRSQTVTGYAISIVIALVGILNFINSMATAIISRRKEFAMMQSIGMTKRQLRTMLTFEGLYYAGMTLAASYMLGALTVGILVRAMTDGGYATFHFTLLPLVVCTPVLIGFAILIPYICFKNLEKRSVVERLRAEG